MAELTQGRVDIISRENGTLLSQSDSGLTQTINLTEPSVVRINGTRAMVVQYERQGDDLILHMRDGSTVRYQKFFFDDAEGEHSELVFDDGVNPPEHALFPDTAEGTDLAAASVTPTYESLDSVEPLLLAENANASTAVMTASGLGILGLAGVAIGASNGGGGGGGGDGGNDNPGTPDTPTVAINPFAGDNTLDNSEKTSDQLLSGTTTNVEAGQLVTVTLGGQSYSGLVGADGSWSVTIPASALAALAAGTTTVSVSVSNAAGTVATGDLALNVEAPATEPGTPTLSINPFAGDNTLDNSEKTSDQTLSGTTTNVEVGQLVTVTLGDQTYSSLVGADGSWSVTVPADALAALAAGTTTISASVSNAAGTTATGELALTVDAPANEPGALTITEPLSTDGYLNAEEAGSDLVINGTAVGVAEGQIVTVNFNGTNYSGSVAANGAWSVTIPASAFADITDGLKQITASVTDINNDTLTDSADLTVAVNAQPQINLDQSAFSDGVLNGVEAGSDQILSGSTGVASEGQLVQVTLNGRTYSATVNAEGNWSLSIPAADLATLPQGTNSLAVTVTDAAGNSSSDTLDFTVATNNPVLVVSPVAGGDGVLNSVEAGSDLPVSGSGATPGAVVAVTLNGQTYSATVGDDGNWTVTVPAETLQGLANGSSYTLGVTLTDANGNVSSTSQTLAVDTQAPVVSVNVPAGDGVLNANDLTQPLLFNGTGTPGENVTVTLNGQTYSAVVDANGQWTASVPPADLANLANQTYPVSVTISDAAGNSTTQTTEVTVASATPAITVDDIGGDGVINASEAQQPLVVTGSGNAGDTITVNLNGQNYSATVGDDGNWSVNIPAADLAQIPNGAQPVTVTATDANGNTATTTDTLQFATTPPTATITQPASDGYINSGEIGQDLILDGAGGTPGNTVSVNFGGATYTTTVGDDGNWQVTVPAENVSALGDGVYPVTVTIGDAYGNSTTVVSDVTIIAETNPTLTVDPVTGDNEIDRAEQLSDVLITGTTTDIPAGQPVIVSINGQNYDGVVQAGGGWSVTLPAGSLGGDGIKTFTVSTTDAAGNPASATGSLTVVTTGDPLVAIAPISNDNALNASEAQNDLAISGSSANLPANSVVTVTLGTNTYSTTIDESGAWTVTVPAADLSGLPQGNQPVTVTAGGAEDSQNLLVATTPLAEPVVATPFDDGILSSEEVNTPQTLTGTATPGETVTVTVGDNRYPTTVDGNGNWSVTIPPTALQSLGQGANTLTVAVSDAAGNVTSTTVPVTVDTGTPTATVNPVTGDGIINAEEAQSDVEVSGSAAPGSSVSVELNGETYSATVAQDGSWTATLPAADLQALPDGRYDLNVTVTSASGNSGTTSSPLTIDATEPTLTVDTLAGDGVLNAGEQAAGITFTGSGSAGDTVSLSLNGVTYTGTVGTNGQWALDLPASDLSALTNGDYPVTVTVSDAAGNTTRQESSLTVDTSAPPLGVDPVSGDNALSTRDLTQPLVVSGTGQNGDDVSVALNGKTYRTLVGVNGRWSLQIAPTDLAELPAGANPLTITVTDAQGNQTTQTTDLIVASDPAIQPTLTIDIATFAGDGVVSAAEQQQPQTLTGSTTNVEEGQLVIATLNGTSYSGVVGAGGEWSIILPATALAGLTDGSQTLIVNVANAVGNSATGEASFSVDTTLSSVALAPVSDDNYLNAQEIAGAVTFAGSTSNIAEGSIVTVNVNGGSFSTTVGADGNWTLTLPAGTFSTAADGALSVTTTVTDAAGTTLATSSSILNVLAISVPQATAGEAFGDNILNGNEAAADGVITGTTGVAGAGQTVTLSLNGVDYSGTVDATGAWQVTLPASVLAALPQGDTTYTVTAADIAGNTSSVEGTFAVNTVAPDLAVNTPSGDGVLNATEVTQPLALSGTSEGNALISATFNGTTISTTADADGNWALEVPATAFSGLVNGAYPLTVTATDTAGNVTSDTSNLTVRADAASLPTLTLNAFAGDNVVDGAERQTDQLLSGTTTNVEPGQFVTVNINGQVFSGAVQSSGAWSLTVPAGTLAGLADGTATYTVAVSDAAGNSTTSDITITANSTASGLALDAISGDNYLNALDAEQPLIISGTSANVPINSTVTVLFNNVPYTATVSSAGTWSAIIPAAALADLPDGPATVTVTSVDSTGATVSSTATLNVLTTLPDPTLATPFGDGVLNTSEIASAQTLSGTTGSSGDGQTVSVLFNGTDYSGTVDVNGNWRIDLPATAFAGLAEGSTDLVVTVTDAAGNTNTATGSVTVDLTPPTLTLEPVAEDDVVNIAESNEVITLTGSSDAGEGQTVTITLNNQTWTTTVEADGSWSFDLPAGALADIPGGVYTLTATVSDASGNSFTETRDITVATNALALSIDTPFGDGYLSQADATQTQTLSGATGVAGEGQTVTVTLNNIDYPADVDAQGNWTLRLESGVLQGLTEGVNTIVVNSSDAAGNTGSVESSITVDFTAPTLTVEDIATDNVINSVEVLQDLPVTGTASVADAGQPVTVTFNGQSYQTQVLNNGSWSVTIPASALTGLDYTATYPVEITVRDAAGNETSSSQDVTFAVAVGEQPTLTFDAISEDGAVNRAEAAGTLTLSGSSTNLAEGDAVTVTLGDTTYQTAIQADGSWSIDVDAADIAALGDGIQTVVVNAANGVGNPASNSTTFIIAAGDTSQPALNLNAVAGDNVINDQEGSQAVEISGGSSNLLPDQLVTITLTNETSGFTVQYQASVGASGNWIYSLTPAEVEALPQGDLTVTVDATDQYGNPASATSVVTVNSDLPLLEGITLSSGDTLNNAESLANLVVTGTTASDLPVTVTLNGVNYSTVADGDGNWSLEIPSAALQALPDGSTQPLTISVTDTAGNVAETTQNLVIATALPTLTLNAGVEDGVINVVDAAGAQTLSGTSSLAADTLITVTIEDRAFSTTTGADGSWSLDVPAGALDGLPSGATSLIVSATDAAGNPAQAITPIVLALTPPVAATVADGQFGGDDAITSNEAGSDQLITGTVDPASGATVSVNVDGTPLTVVQDAAGNWSATFPAALVGALPDGQHTITVTTTDANGNTTDATRTFTSAVTPNVAPTLNLPFGDGAINSADTLTPATLSGTVGIDADAVDTVTVNLNGATYTAAVAADGSWTVDIDTADLQALPDGTFPVTVTVVGTNGNSSSASADLLVIANTLPEVSFNLPFGDGALDATEATQLQTLTGTTGITSAGQTVTVSFTNAANTEVLSGTATVAADGSWSFDLTPAQLGALGNDNYVITVTATDAAGNVDTATQNIVTATTGPVPSFDANLFGPDNILNIAEANAGVTLSGDTGSTGLNQAVSLTIDVNGVAYTGTVAEDGSWTLALAAEVLNALGDGEHTLTLTAVDAAGNTATLPYTFNADLTAPNPTVDAQFDDGFLNANEIRNGFTLTGTTGETGEGQVVTVTMGTTSYTTSVDANGNWSLPLSPTELAGFTEGSYPVSVTASDAGGNSTVISSTLVVDLSAPVLTLNNLAGDNLIDYAESLQAQTLSGTAVGAEPGSVVNVVYNETSLSTTVGANGEWSLILTPQQLTDLYEGTTNIVQVTVTDQAGNEATASLNVTVDLTPPPDPVVTLGAVSADNIISTTDGGTVAVSGTALNLGTGAIVTVTLEGADYSTTVDAAGGWTLTIPTTGLADGTQNIDVSATGPAGTVTTSGSVLVDLTAPTLTIDAFTGDGAVNITDSLARQTISGTASESEAGRIVQITLNNQTYSASVQADGTWSTFVSGADVAALPQGTQTITAVLTDAAGNSTTTTSNVEVDTLAPTITINAYLGDNLVNGAEVAAAQILTGSAPGAEGQTVSLYINGSDTALSTATVQADGSYSLTLAAGLLADLPDGTQLFTVTTTDAAGNAASSSLAINKQANADLDVTINTLFGDNVLNAAEAATSQIVSGTAQSSVAGATVSVTIGGADYNATVAQDGRWSITLPATALSQLPEGASDLIFTVTDPLGNSTTETVSVTAVVATAPVVPALTAVFGDNLLNVAEAAAGQTITGAITNGVEGTPVTVTFAGKTYTTTVLANGNWSLDLPAADLTTLPNGNQQLTVSVTDSAGNVSSNSTTIGVFTQQPTITFTSVLGDGVLNQTEVGSDQVISGVVTNIAQNTPITLNIGGTNVPVTVGANGAFSATVPASVLAGLGQGANAITATVTDAANNTATATSSVRVDTLAPTVTISPLFTDALLSAVDAQTAKTITGVATNADAGSRVVVSVNGQQFATTTTDAAGNFSIPLTPAQLQALPDGALTVGVSVTDAAGNVGTASATATVGTHTLPAITLNPLFVDGVLNYNEAHTAGTVTGSVSNVAVGSTVNVTIGNLTIPVQVQTDGTFTANLTAAQLTALANANSSFTVSAAVSDAVGNTASTSGTVQVHVTNLPTLALNTVFGDGVLSAGDFSVNQTISGTSTNLATGTTVSATLNGVTYTGVVAAGGAWTISVPKTNLAAIADGTKTVTVTASDAYGNAATSTANLNVTSHVAPVVTIASLFGDNALSQADVKTSQTISGTATNAEGSTLNVNINGTNYSTTVSTTGTWSLSLTAATLAAIADGTYTVSASVTNAAGVSGSSTATLGVASHTTPSVTINSYFGGDGYLNVAEASRAETISGSSLNAIGGTVSVNVAGTTYTATVSATGSWSISVPSTALQAIPDGSHSIVATVTDIGGNTATANSSFYALSHYGPYVGVDAVTNILSSTLFGLQVSGSTWNAPQGSTVTVSLLNLAGQPLGITATGIVGANTNNYGRYTAFFGSGVLGGLVFSALTEAQVTITDPAGNSSSIIVVLALGSLLYVPVTTTAATFSTLSVDDSAIAAASADENSTVAATSNGEETTASVARVASTLTTEADTTSDTSTASTSSQEDSSTAVAATAVADDQSYTIGGVVITLADGSTAEGASVTGSSGSDTVTLNTLNFTHIDGGAGTDTLVLNGDNMTLDLTSLGLKVEHIEVLDLGKTGSNTVKLDLNEALNITDKQSDDLIIKGADGNQVMLANTNGGVWEVTGERTVGGQTFEIYHNSALASDNTLGDVLVQHNLQVHIV